ncbi:hypothetical protein GQ53DRAFT_370152 [Thozetella sp. PMI_491]|nr:hypothetical protein GQ53DRAFT_370152 [Thozetella sp. PMI_491]
MSRGARRPRGLATVCPPSVAQRLHFCPLRLAAPTPPQAAARALGRHPSQAYLPSGQKRGPPFDSTKVRNVTDQSSLPSRRRFSAKWTRCPACPCMSSDIA